MVEMTSIPMELQLHLPSIPMTALPQPQHPLPHLLVSLLLERHHSPVWACGQHVQALSVVNGLSGRLPG